MSVMIQITYFSESLQDYYKNPKTSVTQNIAVIW